MQSLEHYRDGQFAIRSDLITITENHVVQIDRKMMYMNNNENVMDEKMIKRKIQSNEIKFRKIKSDKNQSVAIQLTVE